MEGFVDDWLLHQPRADSLCAYPDSLHLAIHDSPDSLQVGLELATRDACHLRADATKTFGFTAGLHPIALARLFAGVETLFAHSSLCGL